MERITQMLDMIAASTLLVTGVYMQVSFEDLLTPAVRAAIGLGVLLYFFLSMARVSVSVTNESVSVSGPSS